MCRRRGRSGRVRRRGAARCWPRVSTNVCRSRARRQRWHEPPRDAAGLIPPDRRSWWGLICVPAVCGCAGMAWRLPYWLLADAHRAYAAVAQRDRRMVSVEADGDGAAGVVGPGAWLQAATEARARPTIRRQVGSRPLPGLFLRLGVVVHGVVLRVGLRRMLRAFAPVGNAGASDARGWRDVPGAAISVRAIRRRTETSKAMKLHRTTAVHTAGAAALLSVAAASSAATTNLIKGAGSTSRGSWMRLRAGSAW